MKVLAVLCNNDREKEIRYFIRATACNLDYRKSAILH